MNSVYKPIVAAALLFGAASIPHAAAQSSGGQYRIDAIVIAGGGSAIAGGNYRITSTLGQAATASLNGAAFNLFDGFWGPAGGLAGDFIFSATFE